MGNSPPSLPTSRIQLNGLHGSEEESAKGNTGMFSDRQGQRRNISRRQEVLTMGRTSRHFVLRWAGDFKRWDWGWVYQATWAPWEEMQGCEKPGHVGEPEINAVCKNGDACGERVEGQLGHTQESHSESHGTSFGIHPKGYRKLSKSRLLSNGVMIRFLFLKISLTHSILENRREEGKMRSQENIWGAIRIIPAKEDGDPLWEVVRETGALVKPFPSKNPLQKSGWFKPLVLTWQREPWDSNSTRSLPFSIMVWIFCSHDNKTRGWDPLSRKGGLQVDAPEWTPHSQTLTPVIQPGLCIYVESRVKSTFLKMTQFSI